jgi:ParB family transcriptional regulator, chromosome partitioning protein
MADRPDSDIELHRLQLRFASMRMNDEGAVRRLMQSIDACGQLVACLAVRDGSDETAPLVLIDGYRRVAALRRLGRDTARVRCSSDTPAQALLLAAVGIRLYSAARRRF